MSRPLSCLLLATTFFALSACHANLDWREVRPPEGAFSLWMPARTFEETRELVIAGQRVSMHQWSARARDTLFAIGYADFAPPTPEALTALRDALVANISGKVLSDQAGPNRRDIAAAGEVNGAPLMLHLRLAASGQRLYQIVVLGKPEDLSAGDVDFFFQSFRQLTPGQSLPAAPPPGRPPG